MRKQFVVLAGFFPFVFGISACSPADLIARSGPSRTTISSFSPPAANSRIPVIPLNSHVVKRLQDSEAIVRFSDIFNSTSTPYVGIGSGDLIEVSLWEAPPAVLFSTSSIDAPNGGKQLTLPEQMVDSDGKISLPFVGSFQVSGKTPVEVERYIVSKLKKKANQPQAFVRLVKNNHSTLTIMGGKEATSMLPLISRGETLLEAIARAGGVKEPTGKISVQLTRQGNVAIMPLDDIIKDTSQNIFVAPGDIITILSQPLSFTVLGASGKNQEVEFESQGITLAQAVARSGGLEDNRADPRGVFVFRFEEPAVLTEQLPKTIDAQLMVNGKIPVVYQVDFKNPETFLWSQKFLIKNKDMVYISNAPVAELSKFLNLITSSLYTVATVKGL